ncbi:MAG: hypothetical protein IPM35_36120 [Myxococcales bacterium]|nr:hypothetical protein [Myxococcales bacterium]
MVAQASISAHMRPRPGVWPVAPERMAARRAWIAEYEARAAAFSACHYRETIGSGTVHSSLETTLELHDRKSGALAGDRTLA